MTQLNTPYPSTAYLTGFLRSQGVDAVQEDLALALVLALGDVPLFALFGQSDQPTLTWYIYRLAGSYRLDQAAQAALMLLLLSSLLIYWMEPRHANRR